ncbi:hypothetical protein [Novosphingobium olei]|uniref:Uncharacterized protein n=1 Tax=Novosphingobium olei TaxID=2728851 RepID=A0A7Y0BTL4_9SPHN|nr:hypothetical protein [Novosphingobium olei]NML96326.1 hypothetical protein [Novosphingobium olei]
MMAAPNLQADSADRNGVRADLLKFEVNGMRLAVDHVDGVVDRLAEAHALLSVLACAFEDAETVGYPAGDRCPISHMRPQVISKALAGR